MIDRMMIGNVIAFQHTKYGNVEAELISYNKDHIQVKLMHDTGRFSQDTVRLFDMVNVTSVIVLNNYKKPEKKIDREPRTRQSRQMTYHEYERHRLEVKINQR